MKKTIRALALLLGSVSLGSAAAITQSYDFSGACIDCNGTVTATLVLQNYTAGDEINNSNFVAFFYNGSNLLPAYEISVALGNFEAISGAIPTGLPGPADLFLIGVPYLFSSSTDGSWSTGSSLVPDDFGNSGTYSAVVASAVPEPATAWLVAAAGVALGLRRLARQ